MVTRNDSLWKTLDWVTIGIYLLLIVGGWFSVCGASYDYGDRDFFDFSTRAGKQFVWILTAFGLGGVILLIDSRLFNIFSYVFYVAIILLLIVTIFVASDVKGSRSWLEFGPISFQPAELVLNSAQKEEYYAAKKDLAGPYISDFDGEPSLKMIMSLVL